jgi:1-acyl-sn-glycerol-3-phosphate acyltransferase
VNVRGIRRAVALAFALAGCVVKYWMVRIRGPLTLEQRARWLHSASTGVLGALRIQSQVQGTAPARGLVVANHLSYLDIVILSAAMPCFFVSKVEVNDWPYFGKAARTGATMFIDRSSRASAAAVARQMAERLMLPVPVLLFPEGTSSDGSQVLRFHSTLFEPAIRAQAPVTAASVRYVLHDGAQERDLCWFDDTTFVAHIWKALCTGGFSAQVIFGEPRTYPDRRAAAAAAHDEVATMRASGLSEARRVPVPTL